MLDSMETFRLKPKSCGRAGRTAPEVGGATRSLRWKYSYGLAKTVSLRGKPAVEGTNGEPIGGGGKPLHSCRYTEHALPHAFTMATYAPIFLGVT